MGTGPKCSKYFGLIGLAADEGMSRHLTTHDAPGKTLDTDSGPHNDVTNTTASPRTTWTKGHVSEPAFLVYIQENHPKVESSQFSDQGWNSLFKDLFVSPVSHSFLPFCTFQNALIARNAISRVQTPETPSGTVLGYSQGFEPRLVAFLELLADARSATPEPQNCIRFEY